MDVNLAGRELEVMGVLWERGSGTVAEVREALSADLAYTTVLTTLQRLVEKGYARREEEGRAHRYGPAVERRAASASLLRRLTDTLFHGSPELLLTQLLEDRRLDRDELRRVKQLLETRLKERES